jgi:hypothetical protein
MINVKTKVMLALVSASYGATATEPLDGVWKSQGWGLVYEIRAAALQAFEVTSTTCVPGFKAQRQRREAGDDAFRTREGEVFAFIADIDSDHKRVVHPTGLTSIVIERMAALPTTCTPPTPNTPLGNFEVFERTFAEHYISFDFRHTDWDRIAAEARAKISSRTTQSQVFEILKRMIQPLADIHTGLDARKPKLNFDPSLRPGTDRIVHGNIDRFAKIGRRQLAAITNKSYLHGQLLSFCRGEWQYGVADSGIGYLRILSFGDYSHGGFDSDLKALNDALDRILGDGDLRGLVIDVRLSFGGDDRLGLAIAARLTSAEYMAYAIQARSDAAVRNRYTPLQPVMVRPGKGPIFGGPIVELIGPITMSAAETFTQALMERTPHVTRIGENTQGVFCDPLGRHLPNGWTFGLPNAVYRSSDGNAFDVTGLSPDIPVPVFADEDVAAGRDPGMAAAMQALGKR